METIKLKAKLSAYTKGVLPTKISQLKNDLNFIEDLSEEQANNLFYVRVREPNSSQGKWVEIKGDSFGDEIELLENSGLILEKIGNTAKLGINQYFISKEEFEQLSHLNSEAIYYIINRTPDLYINGGTAFSDGNNEFVIESEYGLEFNGGAASSTYNLILLPINAKGVYNG